MSASLADRLCFVLVEPAHPGNIGSSARAIKTMGFRDLRVVVPWVKDYRDDAEAQAYATSSIDVLKESCDYATLQEALADVDFAWAMSGYDREFGPIIEPVREAAANAISMAKAQAAGKIAFVFGCERTGLSNEAVAMCQRVAAIAASPQATSLNLSQAVQIMAYELHMTMLEETGAVDGFYEWQKRFEGEPLAGIAATEGFLKHFEQAMIHCGALDPEEPKLFMQRIRRLFARTELTRAEVDLLRGVCSQIICPKESRAGRKCNQTAAKKRNP